MRTVRRTIADPDEEFLRRPPPGFRDPDEPSPGENADLDPDGTAPEPTHELEEDADESARGRDLQPWLTEDPRWPRDRDGSLSPCAICGLPVDQSDDATWVHISSRHSARKPWRGPHDGPCGEAECAPLAKEPTFCALPSCGRSDRIWCFADLWPAHGVCVGLCDGGCGRPRAGTSSRCAACARTRKRQMARDRQRARRLRIKRELKIEVSMKRYGTDRATAERQCTPVLSPAQSADYTRRRKAGTLPPWEPGRPRGWEPTKRPRGVRRRPGTTPEARQRRRYVALRKRRERG